MEFLNPDKVLAQLELKRDMVAADFGSGSGGFAIPLAKKLEDGLVYALDIQREPLSVLKSRAFFENLVNIKIVRSDLERKNGSTLAPDSVDLILVVNLLFQLEDKNAILIEIKRVLKEGGELVVIDWLSGSAHGPKKGKVTSAEVKEMAGGAGFIFRKEISAGTHHFGLIFEKP